jgi:hypothetical protein
MRLTDLERWTNRSIDLTAEFWAKARLFGEARRRSNDGVRAMDQERGSEGNHEVDLQGAAAELILLTCTRRCGDSDAAVMNMRDHLFNPDGGAGVTGADLEFDDAGRRIRIDAKSFACQIKQDPTTGRTIVYRSFAINNRKHAELGALNCDSYFCVIVPHYGRRALVASLVPWADVDAWEVRLLRSVGTPSRIFEMDSFLRKYVTAPLTEDGGHFERLADLAELRAATYARLHIEKLMSETAVRQSLLEDIPSLNACLPDAPFGA